MVSSDNVSDAWNVLLAIVQYIQWLDLPQTALDEGAVPSITGTW